MPSRLFLGATQTAFFLPTGYFCRVAVIRYNRKGAVDRYGDIRINNAFGLTVGVPDGESVRSGCALSCIYMGPLASWSQERTTEIELMLFYLFSVRSYQQLQRKV
jgi:hypothetical protein